MLNISSRISQPVPFEAEFAVAEICPLNRQLVEQLNEREIEELELFNNEKRQREYLSSRLVLKQMAAKIGIEQEQFAILKDKKGQPYGTANNKKYFVSIGHTSQQVFCGITPYNAIGVDLEPVNRNVSNKLKPRILHRDDPACLAKIPAIQLWTIKESFIKLRGQGLRINMNQVQLEHQGEEFYVEINKDKRAKICSFKNRSHWLAIAYYL